MPSKVDARVRVLQIEPRLGMAAVYSPSSRGSMRYLGEHNRKPKPFVWTADPDRIFEKVNRGYQAMASKHPHVRLSK
jgi:hypothetical protein